MHNINLSADVKTFSHTDDNPYEFELVGYTGKVMEKGDWKGIFSLDGMESKRNKVIILREHESDRIVGYGDTFKDERGFIVRGKFSKTTKDGIEVAALLKEGIPLQCSVGIAPESVREASNGELINGFAVPTGMQIWDKSYVGEVSICSWGVDTDTSVHSFAKELNAEAMEFIVNKPLDETSTSFRHRLREPGTFEEGTFRTIQFRGIEGIDMVVGKLKNGDGSMVGQTLIFKKPIWTRERVQDWLNRHKGDTFSMGEIKKMHINCSGDCGEDCNCEETKAEGVVTQTEKPAVFVEESKEESIKELKVEAEFKYTQADMDAAMKKERDRISAIFAASAPISLTKEAIEKGMSEGEAFKYFWMSEKGMKMNTLKEMAAEAPVIKSDKALAETTQMTSEMGYMDLIDKVKEERKCSTIAATKFVMKNFPEAYKKFVGRD